MIKVLHFADLHLGVETYGRIDVTSGMNTRVLDFLKRFDEMIAFARNNDVDLAIFAGDAFKNRQPNPTLQREFAERIRELAELCPVILLVGNHDLPAAIQKASSIDIYDTLAVPNVMVAFDYELYEIPTKHGPVQVATIPYPVRARLLDDESVQGQSIAQLDAILQQEVQLLIRDLTRRAEQSPIPRILVGHFTTTGAVFGSERNIMAGHDATVLLSELADPTWDYVALGHIHKHQNLTEGRAGMPPVVYSGSLERVDFGEEDDIKGFCWVELERNKTTWKFIPVAARRFVSVYIDVRGSEEPMQRIAEVIAARNLEETVTRLTIQADATSEPKLRENGIHELLRNAKVNMIAGVQNEVDRPNRSRLGVNVEGLSSLDLLKSYLQIRKIPPERIDILLQNAEALFKDS